MITDNDSPTIGNIWEPDFIALSTLWQIFKEKSVEEHPLNRMDSV